MTAVLYLHGFASSPASAKIGLLRRRVEPGIVLHTPDLNVPSFERLDFDAAGAPAEATGRAARARPIVGSSLRALMPLAGVRRGPVPALLPRWRARGLG